MLASLHEKLRNKRARKQDIICSEHNPQNGNYHKSHQSDKCLKLEFLKKILKKSLLENNQNSVWQTPDKESPVGAVPDTRKQEYDE